MTQKRHKQQQPEPPQRRQRETTAHEDEDKDGHLKRLHRPPHTSTLSSLRSPPLISSHTFIYYPSFSRYSRWSIIGLCDSGDRSPTLNSPSLPPPASNTSIIEEPKWTTCFFTGSPPLLTSSHPQWSWTLNLIALNLEKSHCCGMIVLKEEHKDSDKTDCAFLL